MARWFKTGVVVALGAGAVLGPAPAGAQVVRERDTTVTGPRGNSLTRDLKSVRGPGFLERETTIKRPGGATFTRDTILQRGGGPVGMPGGGPHFRPGFGGFGPRGVIVNNFGGGGGGGNGLLDFGLGAVAGGVLGGLVGRATAPTTVVTPPPVVVGQPVMIAPAVVQPAPVVVQAPPVYQSGVQQASVVPPDLAAAIQRLQSYHESSRHDACVVIGRLGDDRGVPALIDRLKNDRAVSVRVAAATALGQIGDPKSQIVLERAVIYDKKQEVRDAATASIGRMQQAEAAAADNVTPAGNVSVSPLPMAHPTENVPPPPMPAFPN
jgi:HEAT repeats